MTSRTFGSTGSDPRSGDQAMRMGFRGFKGFREFKGFKWFKWFKGSAVDNTDSSSATSSTVRPSGPLTPKPTLGSGFGSSGTIPNDGRMPTMFVKFAGFRSEP